MPFLISNIVLWGIVMMLVRANLDNNFVNETTKMNETVGYLACSKGNGEFEFKQLFEKKTAVIFFNGVFSGKFIEKTKQYPKYRSYLHRCCEITILVKSELLNSNKNNFSQTASNKNLNQSYDILNCIEEVDGIRFQKMNNSQDGKFSCKIFPDEKNKQNFTDKNTTKSSLHVVSIVMKINRNSACPECNYTMLFVETEVFESIGNSTAVESNGMDPFIYSMNISEKKTNDLKLRNKRAVDGLAVEDIYIPIGGLKYHHRHLRHTDACSFPTTLETAAISCKIYPSSIKCVQRCAFGYTLEDGIQQKMQCNFTENKWVPKAFKECQPFVDCTLSLISGGYSKCSSMSLTAGTECKVECLHYEDKPAVPAETYTCDIQGKWDPDLPFCVVPQSGLALVKAPKIKLHDEYYER